MLINSKLVVGRWRPISLLSQWWLVAGDSTIAKEWLPKAWALNMSGENWWRMERNESEGIGEGGMWEWEREMRRNGCGTIYIYIYTFQGEITILPLGQPPVNYSNGELVIFPTWYFSSIQSTTPFLLYHEVPRISLYFKLVPPQIPNLPISP